MPLVVPDSGMTTVGLRPEPEGQLLGTNGGPRLPWPHLVPLAVAAGRSTARAEDGLEILPARLVGRDDRAVLDHGARLPLTDPLPALGATITCRAYDRGVRASLVLAAVLAFDGAPAGGQEPCTIVGTDGDDVIVGTEGVDVICDLAGDDRVDGRGGDDLIVNGPGDDVLAGGGGNDRIALAEGTNRARGGAGDDTIFAARGPGSIEGGPGRDDLVGGAGRDRVVGGAGDQLHGGAGFDGATVDRVDRRTSVERVLSCAITVLGCSARTPSSRSR
jgi:RTX calcium-binding nonapeptide repeat (4 copies)